MKYKKKPIVIEAVQLQLNNILEVERFIENKEIIVGSSNMCQDKFEDYKNLVVKEGRKIKTLEGEVVASVGDYIIKGIQGEVYPCKPDIFKATYEKVSD